MAQDFTDNCFDGSHSGQEDLQNIEDNFAALKSLFSGASAPANPVAGMLWLDTTNHILKERNEANNAWLNVYNLSTGRVPDADACSGITITANNGLTGGGALSTNRTIGIATGGVTATKLASYTAGDYIECMSGRADSTTSTSYAELKRFYIPRAGTVRVRWKEMASPGATVRGMVYINGSATGNYKQTTSTTYVDEYEDITVAAGDVVTIYALTSAGGTCYIYKACVCCGNPLMTAQVWGYEDLDV